MGKRKLGDMDEASDFGATSKRHSSQRTSTPSPKKTATSKTATSKKAATTKSHSKRSPARNKSKDLCNDFEIVTEEKRLKRFRPHPTQDFNQLWRRALSQTMYVLDRQRTGTVEDPEETIEIAGSTGNVYTVCIARVPLCDCPHKLKGHSSCKHIVYVLAKTLKVQCPLLYQLAFTTSELTSMFEGAPPLPSELSSTQGKNNRKEVDPEEDCPICCEEFGSDMAKITYCKKACGNNMHKHCLDTWAKASRDTGVRCPLCRCDWENDSGDMQRLKSSAGQASENGVYRNVGRELGLPQHRDHSTYHQPWVRIQSRRYW